jgi:hypothetical protein
LTVEELKARADAARIAKARAEATQQAAQDQYDKAMAELTTKFGLDSIEDARAKLEELQRDRDEKVAQVTAILDQID